MNIESSSRANGTLFGSGVIFLTLFFLCMIVGMQLSPEAVRTGAPLDRVGYGLGIIALSFSLLLIDMSRSDLRPSLFISPIIGALFGFGFVLESIYRWAVKSGVTFSF